VARRRRVAACGGLAQAAFSYQLSGMAKTSAWQLTSAGGWPCLQPSGVATLRRLSGKSIGGVAWRRYLASRLALIIPWRRLSATHLHIGGLTAYRSGVAYHIWRLAAAIIITITAGVISLIGYLGSQAARRGILSRKAAPGGRSS